MSFVISNSSASNKVAMKLAFCLLLLAGTSVAYGAKSHASHDNRGGFAAVYELTELSKDSTQQVSMNSALLYLADKFGLGDYYSIGEKDKAIEFIDSIHRDRELKPSLLVIMKGVDSPSNVWHNRFPSFEVQMKKRKSSRRLMKTLFNEFPSQYAKSVNSSHVSRLSDEIKYVSSVHSDSLKQDFKLFHRELPQKWSSVVDSFNSKQNVLANLDSSLQLVNDKLYISELMQLITLTKLSAKIGEVPAFVVANLDSLFSLGSKLGYDARTYKVAKAALLDSIESMTTLFDVTVVVVGPGHKYACDSERMSKRSQELGELFSNFAKRGTSSVGTCFADESECQTATDNCNQHGVCSKVRAQCWQCLCSPTYDKKTSKTTKWAGYDCGKKDIAAQTQLLLWTSVGLLVTLVGGIKLLFNIGNDSLPGVLEAATLKKAA